MAGVGLAGQAQHAVLAGGHAGDVALGHVQHDAVAIGGDLEQLLAQLHRRAELLHPVAADDQAVQRRHQLGARELGFDQFELALRALQLGAGQGHGGGFVVGQCLAQARTGLIALAAQLGLLQAQLAVIELQQDLTLTDPVARACQGRADEALKRRSDDMAGAALNHGSGGDAILHGHQQQHGQHQQGQAGAGLPGPVARAAQACAQALGGAPGLHRQAELRLAPVAQQRLGDHGAGAQHLQGRLGEGGAVVLGVMRRNEHGHHLALVQQRQCPGAGGAQLAGFHKGALGHLGGGLHGGAAGLCMADVGRHPPARAFAAHLEQAQAQLGLGGQLRARPGGRAVDPVLRTGTRLALRADVAEQLQQLGGTLVVRQAGGAECELQPAQRQQQQLQAAVVVRRAQERADDAGLAAGQQEMGGDQQRATGDAAERDRAVAVDAHPGLGPGVRHFGRLERVAPGRVGCVQCHAGAGQAGGMQTLQPHGQRRGQLGGLVRG